MWSEWGFYKGRSVQSILPHLNCPYVIIFLSFHSSHPEFIEPVYIFNIFKHFIRLMSAPLFLTVSCVHPNIIHLLCVPLFFVYLKPVALILIVL